MKIKSLSLQFLGGFLSVIALITSQSITAQQVFPLQLEWTDAQELTQGDQTIKVPSIKGQHLDGDKPNFFWRKKIGSGNHSAEFELLATSPASSEEIAYLSNRGFSVGELSYEVSISNAADEKHVVLNLFPFVKVGDAIHRVTDVSVSVSKGLPSAPNAIQKDFVTNSVLQSGSGIWVKIAISEDGLYKIDKSFLETHVAPLGVDIESLNPTHINIYGNGDGQLPETNSEPRTDDLAKNAIKIVGEGDGSFDDNDYILFHGWGPNRLKVNATQLTESRNTYSMVSCYFININPSEPPLRVQSIANSDDPITNNVTTYSYHKKYESELTSLVSGGQRFYGELFDTELVRSFGFSVPNIDASSPAIFTSSLASNASSASGNTHSYKVNGVQVSTGALPTAGDDFGRTAVTFSVNSPSAAMTLDMTVTRSSPSVLTYLDAIELNARRGLAMTGAQFDFRDLLSVGPGNVAEYTISGLPVATGFVWEVTDRHEPKLVAGGFVGSNYKFIANADSLREYVASNGVNFFTPVFVEQVNHQNLHGLPQADYLIVTHEDFTGQAERLANLHRANGLTVHVVTADHVYNEFSSGTQDATAIRMFAKMFYDRSVLLPGTAPKHLLIFGDGTFDHRNIVSDANYVVTYQVDNSENHIGALVTDDYFGLLDDSESINANDEMDIGVGRLLISSQEIARQQVDKIEHYMRNGSDLYSTATTNCSSDNGSSTFGDWRTKYVQIADDEEGGYFVNIDCEPAYEYLRDSFPEMNLDKLYLDAFQQVATAGGERYPDVEEKINDRIERGALVVNYVGHGGEVGVAEERVITVPQIQDWKNIDRLALIVSATCEFTKYDDPERVSAGEWASLNQYGGAIALMTTTRSVFFGVNSITIEKFIENVFERETNFEPKTFGEIMRLTKNQSGGSTNKRSFTLIGDPALQIALPRMNVVTDSINGLSPSIELDTLSALSKVTIKGHLEDFDGTILTGFNGVLSPTVFDKIKMQQTLGNNATSPVVDFELRNNKIYSGKASVVNGYFEFSFVVPKDINYAYGLGKISYYAEDGTTDAIGSDDRVYVGGIDPNGIVDNEGPQIELFLNEETFVNGGISDETPILLANVFDENGINTVGNGIGHDLIAVLDGETGNPIVLNDYYTADLDSYQSGVVRYNFTTLEPGEHTLSVKVWDVNNNSSEASISFIVQEKTEVQLDHVLNYPNPFTTSTEFFFEHNQACVDLDAQIQIFTVSGRLVKTINENVLCDGFRSKGIAWDGLDDFGDQLAKGVYVYHVKVRTPDGEIAEKTEKLVILR